MFRSRSDVLDIYLLEVVRVIYLVTGQIVIVIKARGDWRVSTGTSYEYFP